MENLIRQTAIKWWRDMSMIDQSFITQKYSTLLHGRGASSLTSREIEMLYLKEHSTEAEVSKEEESVEEAAIKYAQPVTENKEDMSYVYVAGHFVAGAVWQKEQDRELISELLDALKVTRTLNLHLCEPDTVGNRAYKKFQEAITKAEQRIKK